MPDRTLPPREHVDRIVDGHQVYMNVLGALGLPRDFHGLHPVELRVLAFVALQAIHQPVGSIAARVRLSPSHASHVLSGLERGGWVAHRNDPHDLRRHVYYATAAGRELATRWRRKVWGEVVDIVAQWPAPKQEAVASTLGRLADVLNGAATRQSRRAPR